MSAPSWRMHHRTHWFCWQRVSVRTFNSRAWSIGLASEHHLLRTAQLSSFRSSARRPSDASRVESAEIPQRRQLVHHMRANCPACWSEKIACYWLGQRCPGYLTRAGRDVHSRIEKGLTPKASADWPLMRDTVSVSNACADLFRAGHYCTQSENQHIPRPR